MTLPSVRDSAQHTSVANETFRADTPADVQEDDLLVLQYAGDGNLSTLQLPTGDFQGWNLHASHNVSSTLVAGVLWKWADGSEGNDSLAPAASPSEKWCTSIVSLADVDPYREGGFVGTFNTGSANPNQGAVPNTSGDVLYLTMLAGEGATATTASPAGYSTEHTLNNGAADGASLRVAYKTSNTIPEDPGAWTRASTAWSAQIYAHLGVDPAAVKHQRLKNRKTEVLSGTTKNYSVTIPTGPSRRFFALLHVASSTVSAITLDPGGPDELELVPVTDGTTAAETAAAGAARAATWYEAFPVPPPGTYTLRVATSVSAAVALQSTTMINAEQRSGVYHVLNASGSGASATGSLNTPDRGMAMIGAVQAMTSMPTGSPTGFVWNPLFGRQQQSSWTSPHYCTSFAQRILTPSAPFTVTVGAAATGLIQAFSAFTVRYADESPNPLFFYGTF